MNPIIEYLGERVQVTPDTAWDMVMNHGARLVSGEVHEPAAQHEEAAEQNEPKPSPKKGKK